MGQILDDYCRYICGGKYAKLYYLFGFGNMLRNGKDESSSGVFQKKNKNGAPYWVIIILGVLTCIIEASGISTGEQVAFLTLTCSLFWMLSYITSHVQCNYAKTQNEKCSA